MADLATRTLKMEVQLSTSGIPAATEDLRNFTESLNQMTGKARKAQEALEMERMSVEGKYNPDIQRDYEIEKAIKLTKELNLSLAAQDAILAEIVEKHRLATSPASGPMQDQHVTDFLHTQQQAEQRLLAERERAAKETEKLRQQELSHYQRYVAKIAEYGKMNHEGIIDDDGFALRATNAKREYDTALQNEAKKVQAIQDALDKQAAAEKEAEDKKLAAVAKAEDAKQAAIAKTIAVIRSQQYDAGQVRFAASQKAMADASRLNRAEHQKAINLINSYSDVTERAATDTAYFNAALANGTITAEEHARAIAGVDRRMRSMAGGAGNMGYVVGNVMTGLEDFTTVLSITGFGMDGFAAATRSASNNVGQAVRGMGTASAAMLAPMVSIGMVLVGFAIPAIYRWATGAEEAAKATEKWNNELAKLERMMTVGSRINLFEIDKDMLAKDVGKMFDADKLKEDIDGTIDSVKRLEEVIEGAKAGFEGKALGVIWKALPQESVNNFNRIADALGEELGGEEESKLRARMDELQKQFINDSLLLGGEAARQNLNTNMDALIQLMNSKIGLVNEGGRSLLYALVARFEADIDDQIAAAEEVIKNLDPKDLEAISKQEDELKLLQEKKRLMDDQLVVAHRMQDIREEGERFAESINNRAELENDLEILRIQNTKNKLLGEENVAERKLLDLALRRREVMESGLAAPNVLEDMFNGELEAIAADIENKLSRLENISVHTGMESQAQAYTNANKQMMEAAKEQKTEEKEMVQLLKAIKDHLAGGNMLDVRLQ